MAQTLYKTGITTGQTVTAAHVTQSIDAFTGGEAYNISLSGSFNMTGSIALGTPGGDLTVVGPSTLNGDTSLNGNTSLVNNLSRNCTITGSLLITGSTSTVGNLTTVGSITGTNIIATTHLSSSGNLTVAGNSTLGNAPSDTTTINGNITGTGNITVASFVSGSTIIGRKNGTSQDNSGGEVEITMTTTTYPPGSIIAITQTTSNNAVEFTLPSPTAGLHYTFTSAVTSTGTGTTTFSAASALLNGIAICADATELVESKTRFVFDAVKFVKGTRLYFISDGSIWNITAYCLCDVGNVSSS